MVRLKGDDENAIDSLVMFRRLEGQEAERGKDRGPARFALYVYLGEGVYVCGIMVKQFGQGQEIGRGQGIGRHGIGRHEIGRHGMGHVADGTN